MSDLNKFFNGFLALALLALAVAPALASESPDRDDTPSRKIVVFKSDVTDFEKSDILRRTTAVRIKKMRQRTAEVAELDRAGQAALEQDERVLRVEDDVIVEALEAIVVPEQLKKQAKRNASSPAQILPWGIDRIDAEKVWPLSGTGSGVNVGVIDTGISASHPDLSGNIKGGVSEVWYTSSWNDDNGHGSHVAGIIGAINNTTGVVGAAHDADLYAIKVLDRNGSGYLSDVIDGIDWARFNDMDVINLSLGCDCPSETMHEAVVRAHDAGIIVVAAAGNSSSSVIYPAAYPEAIAVAATDSSNKAPYWSSRGPEVDLAAPGVKIYSTYKGSRYTTMSGTSMASPHVAGVAALVLSGAVDPSYDENGSRTWDPDEVQNKLQATAKDLGSAGRDDVYGYGLLDALAAFSL